MSFKTKILGGAAMVAALGFGGAASAYDLVIGNADGVAENAIEAANYAVPENWDTTDEAGFVEFTLDPSDDASFTTDDVKITITLTGATFGTGVTPAILDKDDQCFTSAAPVSGGGAGDASVTFLVSGISGCDGIGLDADLTGLNSQVPFVLDGSGAASIKVDIVTDSGGTSVDGGTATVQFLQSVPAYSLLVAADEVATQAEITGGFVKFSTGVSFDADLADVTLLIGDTNEDGVVDADDVDVYVDLITDVKVDETDIDEADLVLTASPGFAFLDDAGDTISLGVNAFTVEGTTASLNIDEVTFTTDTVSVAIGTQDEAIPITSFTPSYTLTFDDAAYSDVTGAGTVQGITREGTQVLVPWVAGTQLSNGNTPTNNIIRISNLGSTTGAVYGEVITSTLAPAGYEDAGLVQLGTLSANGEVQLNQTQLAAALGEFGRGDVELTIEVPASDLTVKRVQFNATTGSFTELSLNALDDPS